MEGVKSRTRPAARHPRARISGAHVALARADTPCAAVSKRVLSHAITANRPPARSRARAPFPGFDASRPKSGTLLVSKRAFSNVGRAPGGAAPAGPHQWRAWGARTRRHAVRRRGQARAEPCDHGMKPTPRARSRARAPFPGFKTRRDLNRNLGEAQKSHAARKPRRSTRARRVLRSCSPWCAVDSGARARSVGATVVHQPGASEATTRDVLPAAPALSRRPQT